MALTAIESLLNNRIGLDPASIGKAAIARVVRHRAAACGLSDAEGYLARLRVSEEELEELIEEVIVPETWFFRDREPFTFLGHHVASEGLPPNGVLRVLSVPCSTGEEPYSIAMTLLDAGLSPGQFRVDAIDVSKRALLAARRAVYGRNSFRDKDQAFRERYFELQSEGSRLLPPASQAVHFVQGNLLNSPFLAGQDLYDIVFCRNLLIYFDRRAREQAIDILDRVLKKSGLLFLGHAETIQIWTDRFISVNHPRTFAYRRREASQKAEVKSSKNSHASRITRHASKALQPVTRDPRPVTAFDPRPPESPLETAALLADQGRLAEAAALCETYLREQGPHPQAYYLLGAVRQASGDEAQAEAHFNRTLYLDPHHQEALLHLVLLAEHRGDRAGAALLRQRARRAQEKGSET